MLQRDILEVAFLLDYFRSNEARIAEWRGCTESERNKKFGAYKVRTALDDRDGFKERKRALLTSSYARWARTLPIRASGCLRPQQAATPIADPTLRTACLK